MNPILAYHNLFETGTVTATEEATGFEKENAYDWRPFDWWQPISAIAVTYLTVDSAAAVAADYWAIYSHSGITSIQLEESTDNFGASIVAQGAAVFPTGNELIFRSFTTSNFRYRRLKINHLALFSLGIAAVGQRIDVQAPLPPGFSPLQRKNKLLQNKGQGGNFLGRRVLRSGYSVKLELDLFNNTYMRSTLEPFIDHAEVKPFFFSWESVNFEDEALFVDTLDGVASVDYSQPNLLRMFIKGVGQR